MHKMSISKTSFQGQMDYLYEEKFIEKGETILSTLQFLVSGRTLSSIRHLARSLNNAGNTYYCFNFFYIILFIYLAWHLILLPHITCKDQMIMKRDQVTQMSLTLNMVSILLLQYICDKSSMKYFTFLINYYTCKNTT